jgi:hypothetical protein
MKKVILGLSLAFAHVFFGQTPYGFQPEKPRLCLAVYIVDEQPSYTHYLRIFDHEFESLVYFKQGDTLCELTRCNYQVVKQGIRTGRLKELKRIHRQDSLTFAQDISAALEYFTPTDEYAFQIDSVNELFQKTIAKHVFYENKVHALLKIKPVLTPIQLSAVVEPWYIHPLTGQNLISAPCWEAQNFACICASLQFGNTTQRQTAQQVAAYLIERFDYGYGDTSQCHPLGLLTGTQNLAVCMGYSQMYELLLKNAHISAKYVDGAVRTDLNDIFYSGYSHAWNELVLDGKRYCSDITWAKDTNSNWLLNTEANFFLTHFRKPTNDSLWDNNYQRTMYEFMHQPMVRDPEKNAFTNLQYLKNGLPMQFMEDEFTVRFSKSFQVSQVQFYELTYPFVRFESEKSVVTQLHLSDGKKLKYEEGTKEVSFTLKDQFTRISLHVKGIGTLDFCVFNGTQTDFYRFVIDHIDAKSPYSVAMAFLACAKLNDAVRFQQLKPFLSNPKMSFKTFQKQAKIHATADFQFALFNAIRYYGAFSGFSFQYANAPSNPKIYLSVSDDELRYTFAGFDTERWNLNKK